MGVLLCKQCAKLPINREVEVCFGDYTMSTATGIPDKLWQPPHAVLETT